MYLAKNNAYSVLASAINATDTTITVQVGHGERFPIVASPNYTYVTLEDTSGNMEIIKVTARTAGSDSITIEREQFDTTGRSFVAGAIVSLRPIAEIIQTAINHIENIEDAHNAESISFPLTSPLTSTNVKTALIELAGNIVAEATTRAAAITSEANARAAADTSLLTAVNTKATLAQVYPVGSVYINAANGTNPASLLGFGTWVAFGTGRTIVGINTGDALMNEAEEVFGSANATLPSHNHTLGGSGTIINGSTTTNIQGSSGVFGNASGDMIVSNAIANKTGGSSNFPGTYYRTLTIVGGNHNHSIAAAGESAANKNYQPSIVVYMWKRTA